MSAVSTNPIAELNDQLRSEVALLAQLPKVPGTVLMTQGISCHSYEQLSDLCRSIREFDSFTEDNDPYGEHDFGSLNHPDIGKAFWKIDYYANVSCTSGSEDPSDPAKSYRVLTIMLASEY